MNLTILLVVFTVVLSVILTVLTLPEVIGLIVAVLSFDVVFTIIPPLAAALIIRNLYLKVNKEILPRKTKLIIVISYFVLQQLIGLILFFLGFNVNILVSVILQLGVALLLFLCLSFGRGYVKKLSK